MTATILLVRHGETTWNRDGRVQGWADSTLTEAGRDQARAIGTRLANDFDLDRLVVSDLKRTRETAAVFDEGGIEPDPSLDRAWRERRFGALQGLTRTDIASRHPEYHPGRSLHSVQTVEGGESLLAFQTRVLDGWSDLRSGVAAGETVVVVTHGGPIRAVLADVTDRDLTTVASSFAPSNCGLTEVDVEDGACSVVARDDTDHRSL